MHLFTARLSWPAALFLLAGALASAPAAPVGSDADTKKGESPVEKIKKVLDQTTDLDITDQPLGLAIAQLREQTRLNFVIDRLTIANLGIDLDQSPVNVKLHHVKLRSALRTILGQYGLSYAVIGDTVVITSEEMAMYRQMRQRVSVDVDRVQLAAALKQLARETGTNLVLDTRVHQESQTPVTLQLEDVPLDMVVRLMAEMAGLRLVRLGNVLFVTSKATAAELRSDPDLMPAQPGLIPGEEGIPRVVPFPGGLGGAIGGIRGQGGVAPAVPVPPAPPPPLPQPEEKPPKPEDKPPEGGTLPPKPPEKGPR